MFKRYSMEAVSGLKDEGYRIIENGHHWNPVAILTDPDHARRIVDLLNADDERQRIGKLIEARNVLGTEIVDIVNPAWKETA